MTFFTDTFRLWWQKPRSIDDLDDHREVNFLELSYDLIYVGILAQLTHALVAHAGHVHIPRTDRDYAVAAGLRVLEMRHSAACDTAGVWRVAAGERVLAAYYANSIAHLLDG